MLGERLRAARHARFVGRAAEKTLFQSALESPEFPFFVLYIWGPGGVGKTTLLQEFRLICEQHDITAYYVDTRNVEPSSESFTSALRLAMSVSSEQSVRDTLASLPRCVLLFDTYETLEPLDDWIREEFLTHLPENTLVVLAGRHAPSPAWRSDSGWQSLMHTLSLRNLAANDSVEYLLRRSVPPDQHKAVLGFTHGHPLALSLVADVFTQRPDIHFQPESVPDVVQTLLAQFAQKVPGPAHRAALEACSMVRLMTVPLLSEMLALGDEANAMFGWLHGLSFMESGSEGIFPHDLAREALATDVHWRNPEWYAELHSRARNYYFNQVQQTTGALQQRILFDYIYLHRDNPFIRPFFEWKTGGNIISDSMKAQDISILKTMVAQLEGDEAARLASYWFSRQPESVTVLRDAKLRPLGFFMTLALHQTTATDAEVDPAVRACMNFLNAQAPLRANENAILFRFWMSKDDYQQVSPVQSVIFVNMVRQYLAPGLAYSFLPCTDADFWMPAFTYVDLQRILQADFTVGSQTFGVYGHDWRVRPPIAWLEYMGEREVAGVNNAAPPKPAEQVIVLSEPDFESAVQDALRDYTRPVMLRNNPLLRSRLIAEKTRNSQQESERIAALRTLLREAAEVLQQSTRETKFYRPLYHTYLQPAATQEQAAELLDLPFSSYRRHLKNGITRVVEILWAQEIGGLEAWK
ncbi:MAG: ATP-binding protein [Chloroflexi bacterium]|nr:ATP-binding protein [Chloroflexota bacterium]MCC6893636.1 ATP-binding protein [Anaerolineae bacterium]